MQAQDYAGAKWAIGMRLPGSTDADIEAAFNRGAILRTHVLRPTWHFVAPADLRWLLALTAPRIHAANARMYRQLALDTTTFRRSHRAIVQALRGGQHLARAELRAVLEQHGIATGLERMAYLLMREELDAVICSGPRRGKQFTYALLDERVRPTKGMRREDALAQLALRFFRSRGPATAQDLAKWSGLTLADAKQGLEAIRSKLPDAGPVRAGRPAVHLLSVYDEYFSSYRDGSAIISAGHALRRSGSGESGLYVVAIDGVVVGRWSRAFGGGSVTVTRKLFRRVTAAERQALDAAVDRFKTFVGASPAQ